MIYLVVYFGIGCIRKGCICWICFEKNYVCIKNIVCLKIISIKICCIKESDINDN